MEGGTPGHMKTLLALPFLLLAVPSFADTPTHACRVKKETLKEYATVESNAGCVVHRVNSETSEVEFLMVYVDKSATDRGWGFPGGKPATKKNDLKENAIAKALATRTEYEYSEPVVCTAGRETFEETGIEVVVETIIDKSDAFIAFQCSAVDPELTKHIPTAVDTKEIKKTAWVTLDQVKKGTVPLRFESNLPILEKAYDALKK